MCGISLLAGPDARSRLDGCLGRLRHRGPDSTGIWAHGDVALGFARLAINGAGTVGHQPYVHDGRILAFNGEIYNHVDLAIAHELPTSDCDVHVVLPLLARHGVRVLELLDGFYSAVVVDETSKSVLCLRDHMGKKPLFVGRSGEEIFITSELKVIDAIDWFALLPRGASCVSLDTGEVELLAEHTLSRAESDLATCFGRAVAKRLPRPEQPVGVFLSGGLDSSLVAAFVNRHRPDATYFTLGNHDGPDRQAVETLREALALADVRYVPLPADEELPGLIREVVYATESYNPSIISNGLATYLLARAAHSAGIKVVLSGEGADELFGGYHHFGPDDPWREVRRRLIDDMQFTELRRLDLAAMAHSVEPRCPFLDRDVRAISDGLDYGGMFDAGQNKVAVRRAFAGVIPDEILLRRKTSFDVGSGLRAAVVRYLRRNGRTEREELAAIWRSLFPHDSGEAFFHTYPVFDTAIDRRGEVHK